MKFYRYETKIFASISDDIGYTFSLLPDVKLHLYTYELYKETPKGYWITHQSIFPGGWDKLLWKKWISKTSTKRYAYPTKKEALINYIKRTERRIKLLEGQINISRSGLALAKNKFEEIKNEERV